MHTKTTTIIRVIILAALLAGLLPHSYSVPAPAAAQGDEGESADYLFTFDSPLPVSQHGAYFWSETGVWNETAGNEAPAWETGKQYYTGAVTVSKAGSWSYDPETKIHTVACDVCFNDNGNSICDYSCTFWAADQAQPYQLRVVDWPVMASRYVAYTFTQPGPTTTDSGSLCVGPEVPGSNCVRGRWEIGPRYGWLAYSDWTGYGGPWTVRFRLEIPNTGNAADFRGALPEGRQITTPLTFDYYSSDAGLEATIDWYGENEALIASESETLGSSSGLWLNHSFNPPDTAVHSLRLVLSGNGLLDNVAFVATEPPPPPPLPSGQYTYPLSQEDLVDITTWSVAPEYSAAYANWLIQPHHPLNYADPETELDSVPFTGSNEYQLMTVASAPGAFIHSPMAGTVESITPIDSSFCNASIFPDTGRLLPRMLIDAGIGLLPVPGAGGAGIGLLVNDITNHLANPDELNKWCLINGKPAAPYSSQASWYLLPVGDLVALYDHVSRTTLYYLVADADEYLTPGQNLAPGCVLGRALPLFETAANVQYEIPSIWSGYGAAFVWAENELDEAFDIRSRYIYWPKADDPCNLAGESDCINGNDRFLPASPFYWYINPLPVQLADPVLGGLNLDGNTSAAQVIAVSGTDFAISLSARVEIPNSDSSASELVISLGDTTHTVTLPPGGAQIQTVIPNASYTDSNFGPAAMLLSIAQTAGQDGEILLKRICVADSAPAFDPMPECVIDNPGFDGGGSWNLTDGAAPTVISSGSLKVTPEGYGQTYVYLPADNYTIDVKYRPAPSATPPASYTAGLTWSLLDATAATMLDSGTWTTTDGGNWVEASASFTMATGDYVWLRLGADTGSDPLEVDAVCLTPQYLPVDTPPWQGETGPVSCNSCPRTYVGNLVHDVPEAVNWLQCEGAQLYYCDARAIMTETRDAAENTVRGIGMLGKWLSATISRQMATFKSLAFYIAGHIHNAALRIADGRVIMIEGQSIGFWDVINSLITGLRDVLVTALDNIVQVLDLLLNFLAPAVSTLASLIVGVANILITVFNLLLAQVMLIPALAATVVNSFVQTSAMPIPGAPNCLALNSNPLCMGIYVIDNTIFSGPAGLLIPILLASATLWLAIWTIDRFAGAFQ